MLGSCVAGPDRLRLIAHLGGDLAGALPYLNAELPQGSYVVALPVFEGERGDLKEALLTICSGLGIGGE